MVIKRNIPNALTCCNLMSGCIATGYAYAEQPQLALAFIVLGAVFDFFDGFAARWLHVSSAIGKELDSLADDVTFGVAPATMVYMFLYRLHYPQPLLGLEDTVPYVAFLIAAFSALRLAKFNLDKRQTTSFIGLPTPANALFWAALIIGVGDDLVDWKTGGFFLTIILVAVSCYLLVAEIPMFALKFKSFGWRGNEVRYVFLAVSILLLALMGVGGLAAVILWYVFLSAITQKKVKRTPLAHLLQEREEQTP